MTASNVLTFAGWSRELFCKLSFKTGKHYTWGTQLQNCPIWVSLNGDFPLSQRLLPYTLRGGTDVLILHSPL